MMVICFVIITMIMEASIPDISVFAGEVIPSRFDVAIFTIMILIYAFGQFVILRFVRQTGQSVKSPMLRLVHTSVSVIPALPNSNSDVHYTRNGDLREV